MQLLRAAQRFARGAGPKNDDYAPSILEDYVDKSVALARIKVKITQAALARRMSTFRIG